jgi:hypothetical protein
MRLQRTGMRPREAEHRDSPHADALQQPDAQHYQGAVHEPGAAAGRSGRQPADPVLTRRIAASLAQHHPGWLLPRPSVLVRRYHVTTEQVSAAIDELAARHLVRMLPDGKACRISPADYMLELEGQHGLCARVEPLGIASGDPVCILQMLWTLSGQPAAATTTYLAGPVAEKILAEIQAADPESFRTILPMPPARIAISDGDLGDLAEPGGPALIPHALHIEMQQPPPWAAKALPLGVRLRHRDHGQLRRTGRRPSGRPHRRGSSPQRVPGDRQLSRDTRSGR